MIVWHSLHWYWCSSFFIYFLYIPFLYKLKSIIRTVSANWDYMNSFCFKKMTFIYYLFLPIDYICPVWQFSCLKKFVFSQYFRKYYKRTTKFFSFLPTNQILSYLDNFDFWLIQTLLNLKRSFSRRNFFLFNMCLIGYLMNIFSNFRIHLKGIDLRLSLKYLMLSCFFKINRKNCVLHKTKFIGNCCSNELTDGYIYMKTMQ